MLRRSARTGFTLIELLVVVAIISLLIAILLPSLAAARNKGKEAKCLSNMHAIGSGFATYSADFQGTIMPYAWNDNNNTHNGTPYNFNTSYWFPEMAEWGYIAQSNNIDAHSQQSGTFTENITNSSKSSVFMCPSGLDRADATWEPISPQNQSVLPNSYCPLFDAQGRVYQSNYWMAGMDPGVGSSPGIGNPMFSWINDPGPNLASMFPARYVLPTPYGIGYAKEVMVEQPSAVGILSDGFLLGTYDNFQYICTRHGNNGNNSANWLFMDGHAANLKKGTYPSAGGDAFNPAPTLQQPQFEVRITLRRL
jgi:prepilin-type N-terminal cleavage/methylation domain-containing protein